jgi:ribonuclease Z
MRELIILGTASQVPTRYRNHNAYVLRWDDETILFDPGEGTQRQMMLAGLAVSPITRICVTHFHGDHSLGLPGVIQRISLDRVPHPVVVNFPAGGRAYFDRLRHATSFWDHSDLRPEPVGAGFETQTSAGRLTALPLWHSIETYGYRLVEPDGRRMLPDRLAAHGIAGPAAASCSVPGGSAP